MLKLFRYLEKAYLPIAGIVILLIMQATCELSLPTYTSSIVNVGIQQGGIEDAVPEVMREETFQGLSMVMKEKDADKMRKAYELYSKKQVSDSKYKTYKEGKLYVRKKISAKERANLDKSMAKGMLTMSSQMAKQMA
ncbi:MAG: ABC transporter ATP-binding protein, partial [Anaerostipes faecalis]|nr:ABC transporter ATP-binding protein [Anaerostipes faecalis]